MNKQEATNHLVDEGWNDEVINPFLEDQMASVEEMDNREGVIYLFDTWFRLRITKLQEQMTRAQKNALAGLLFDAKFESLDEAYANRLALVTKSILGRGYLHDNDHEYFALQDHITAKVTRYLYIIVKNYLANQ